MGMLYESVYVRLVWNTDDTADLRSYFLIYWLSRVDLEYLGVTVQMEWTVQKYVRIFHFFVLFPS